VWALRNNGRVAWPEKSVFAPVDGNSMGGEPQVLPFSLPPGEQTQVEVQLVSPHAPGRQVYIYIYVCICVCVRVCVCMCLCVCAHVVVS
jgi:hypothetical protein